MSDSDEEIDITQFTKGQITNFKKLGFIEVDSPMWKKDDYVFSVNYNPNKPKAFNNRGYNPKIYESMLKEMKRHNTIAQVMRKDDRMLYWDIDYLLLTDKEFHDFIDKFISVLNQEIAPSSVTLSDLQIHTKRGDGKISEKIKSVHIICTKYHMHRLENRNLALTLRYALKKFDVDDSVYKPNGRLYNCFSGKVGGNLFEYHSINTKPYELLWIDRPSNTSDPIEYKKEVLCDKVVVNTDTIEHLLLNKKRYLWSSSRWFNVCGFVKATGYMTREDFCERSLIGRFTYRENLVAWDTLDTKYAYKDIDRLMESISNERIISNPVNKRFFDFINASDDTIEKFKEYDSEAKELYVNDIVFNINTGVLQRPNKKTILYYQHCYKSLYDTKPTGKIIDITPTDLSNQLDKHKHLFVNGIYGSAKTRLIISPIIRSAIEHNKSYEIGDDKYLSVLVITENNALNRQYQAEESLQLTSHLESKTAQFQVCSLESLRHLTAKPTYSIIILDEFVTLMGHFLSDKTMRKQEKTTYTRLMELLRTADRVIVCDADLTHETYPHVLDTFSQDRTIHKLKINHYDNYTYNLVFEHQTIYKRIKEDLNNKKRVVIAFDIAKNATSYMETLCNNTEPAYKILSVIAEDGSDGWKINNKSLDQEQTASVTKDLGAFIVNEKIDIMIYSPKITTGVSINGKCFDNQYGIATGKSVTARQFVQMIHRARNLTDENIFIAVPNPRAKNDLSYINSVYMEKQLSTGTNALKQIVRTDLSDSTRVGLTQIITEAQSEQERSRRCFTSELYKQLNSLGLNTEIILVDSKTKDSATQLIDDTPKAVNIWLKNGLMTISEIESMIQSEKNGTILTKQQHINKQYLHIFLNATITYTTETKSHNPNKPPIINIETYQFNGLFPYEYLHGLYPRLEEHEVRHYATIKTQKERLLLFNHELELSETEIITKYREHYKTTSDNVLMLEMKKHIAFHFYRLFKKLSDKRGLIDKKQLNFTAEHIEIINYLQHKTKLNNKTKLADVMVAVSRIIRDYYGVSYIVCASKRNFYVEVPNKHIIDNKYESQFREKMKALNIKTIACRSPIKDKIMSAEPTTNNLGDYLGTKLNIRSRNQPKDLYDTKHDRYGNKTLIRKMVGTPYAKSPMYRQIVPTGIMEEHYGGAEPNIDKVDIPIITEVMTYEYPVIPTDKLDLISVYEPTLNSKTKQLSYQNTAPKIDDDFMLLKRDVGRKELIETKVPIKLDIGDAKPTGRNDFLLKDIRVSAGVFHAQKNNWDIFEEGDIVFVEFTPAVKTNVYDRDNYDHVLNQEKSVYYFIFHSSYTEPVTLYHAYVRTGLDIECDYEATDKLIDCYYIDYKMHSVSHVIDQIVPNHKVAMPYIIDGHPFHSIYYADLKKSQSHKIINSGKNRRYFKHKEPSADEIMMRECVASNENMMRRILKNWRKSIDYKLGAKKPIIRQANRTKSTAVINPIIQKIKPKPTQIVHIEKSEPTESELSEIRKENKRKSAEAVKAWGNGIQVHMKPKNPK